MITRTAIALGLVWFALSRHPDPGLPAQTVASCGTDPCSAAQDTAEQRDAIFRHLQQVRNDMQENGSNYFASVLVEGREAAVQKAARLPGHGHRARREADHVSPGGVRS